MPCGSALRTRSELWLVAALATSCLPAFGQSADDDTCHKGAGQPAIEACTRLIDAKRASGREYAVLLNDRGLLFHKREMPRAHRRSRRSHQNRCGPWLPPGSDSGLAKPASAASIKRLPISRAGIIAPQRAIICKSRGGAYSRKGDDAQAIADYSRAIELDPKLAIAWASARPCPGTQRQARSVREPILLKLSDDGARQQGLCSISARSESFARQGSNYASCFSSSSVRRFSIICTE